MKKGIKYALLFTGGVAVGIGVCGASLISYAFSDEDIRDGIKNKISRKVDKALYGERPRRNYGSRVSYKSYFAEKRKKSDFTYSIDDIIFESMAEAERVKEQMSEIINEYGYVTVADVCGLANVVPNYMDSKYGWTYINSAKVTRIRDGYYIKLPKPLPID